MIDQENITLKDEEQEQVKGGGNDPRDDPEGKKLRCTTINCGYSEEYPLHYRGEVYKCPICGNYSLMGVDY